MSDFYRMGMTARWNDFGLHRGFKSQPPPRAMFSVWSDLDEEVRRNKFNRYAEEVNRAFILIAHEAITEQFHRDLNEWVEECLREWEKQNSDPSPTIQEDQKQQSQPDK